MNTEIYTAIHEWYKIYGRVDLPWRTTKDPYHIYISEVMLQQTQVKTVLERYYFPFLEKFPTLSALGNAELKDVLKIWEGLGYYARAKNLHKTAVMIDMIPSSIDELITLPGIGKNTAHAIATFAFKQPVPVMEANVKRIICRLNRFTTPDDKKLWDIAYTLVDQNNAFDYNQAMMDLGATVCLPKNPKCSLCPLNEICNGKDELTLYPSKKKKFIPTREHNILVSVYNDQLSLTQRKGKFLHGLWGFDTIEKPSCAAEHIGEVTHAYTHFKLICKVYVYYETCKSKTDYFTIEEIQKLAISKVDEKIVKLFLDTM